MTILVTGANGQLGNEMRIIAEESADRYIFTDVTEQDGVDTTYLDITNLEAVRSIVAAEGVETIVNCAAWTNVDAAESNAAMAEKLNADAAENLAIAMKETGGLLIQISTDYVFGKEPYNTPCHEDQKGTPTGIYGLTKLHGEEKIKDTCCNFVIIRTAWLYSEYGKNFCKTIMSLISSKPQINVVFDQTGTPTYALDLAKAISTVLADYSTEHKNDTNKHYSKTGIYNFSNEGVCSWYDFAKMIAEYSGLSECCIRPCHSSEFPSPVTRPSYSVLDKTKFKKTFGTEIPYWTDSLKKCISNLKHGK